jgi:hypothetical protein
MRARISYAVIFVLIVSLSMTSAAHTSVTLVQLSSDPFKNSSSQHKTQVEPDVFGAGSTLVSAFQSGRFYDGGSSDIGFVTSVDGGAHWTGGFLPGITRIQHAGNPWDRASDPAVAYDARHGLWLISTLPLIGSTGQTPVVSRSADGLHWSKPVQVGGPSFFGDKEWITCDDTASSPYYGHCYVEYDDAGNGQIINMVTTTDGGRTWGPVLNSADFVSGIGGQPVVQPNGNVIVVLDDSGESNVIAFSSHDGGNSWTSTSEVSTISDHFVNGGLRTSPLPSAAVDGSGEVYVVWQDCSFRSGCNENDIVLTKSSDGLHWTTVSRIPIDSTGSSVDHFIPGLAADPSTGGNAAHLGLTYYFYPQTNCSTCLMRVGYTSSRNSGNSWHAPTTLTGDINVTWLANTNQGYMVGDYQGTAYSTGVAHGVFAVARAPTGGVFNEAMFTRIPGPSESPFGPYYTSYGERPLRFAHSDHPPRRLPTIIQ